MITLSMISCMMCKIGAFIVIVLAATIFTSQITSHNLPADTLNDGNGLACRSTESLYPTCVTRLLFSLLQLSYSARYLIAWIAWLRPLCVIFLLPAIFVLFLYSTAFLLQLYLIRRWLLQQFETFWLHQRPTSTGSFLCPIPYPTAQLLRRIIAAIWDIHGRIVHGYELEGLENLPIKGPAFLVYYHGTLPLDAYYFIARYIIERDRHPIPIVDRFLFRLPGLQQILNLTGAFEGSVDECVNLLKPSKVVRNAALSVDSFETVLSEKEQEGSVLLLSPGGVREALFADEYYSIVWGNRRGFARVAIRARVPVYPVFTENVREAIRVVQFGKRWWRRVYEITRLPFAIFYGYFPVKLRTHIGNPIYPILGETDGDFVDRVRVSMEDMIKRYQWTPGNILIALLQRIPIFDNWVIKRKTEEYHRENQTS